jgi:hypothetical protein
MVTAVAAPAGDTAAPVPGDGDAALAGLLLLGLEALWQAGECEQACRLAGQAYVRLRRQVPQQAALFDRALHCWTRAEMRRSRGRRSLTAQE